MNAFHFDVPQLCYTLQNWIIFGRFQSCSLVLHSRLEAPDEWIEIVVPWPMQNSALMYHPNLERIQIIPAKLEARFAMVNQIPEQLHLHGATSCK